MFAITVPISVISLLRPEIARRQRFRLPWGMAAAAAALAFVVVRMAVPQSVRDNDAMPLTALAHVPASLKAQPVFNEYSYGGPLILAGVKPYIDGRGDMYGDAYNAEYARIVRGDIAAFRRADQRWRFGWVIVPWTSGLAGKLAKDPAWRKYYSNTRTVVFVRS